MITPVLLAQEWLSLLEEQVMMSVSSVLIVYEKARERTTFHLLIPSCGPAVLDAVTYLFNPTARSSGYPHSTDEGLNPQTRAPVRSHGLTKV